VKRLFEYKDVPQHKKMKLVTLKLRKYASLWWKNVVTKRVKRGKMKIRNWEKTKSKLKGLFLPPLLPSRQLLQTPQSSTR